MIGLMAKESSFTTEVKSVITLFEKDPPEDMEWACIVREKPDMLVDTLTCMTLALLYDDPKKNNFDCPWDWKTYKCW
jgi:hypothetical protein